MAPDVQMHLSFPKRSSSQMSKLQNGSYSETEKPHEKYNETNGNYADEEDTITTDGSKSQQQTQLKAAILPPPPSIPMKFNPKRTLTKNCYGSGIMHPNTSLEHNAKRDFDFVSFLSFYLFSFDLLK